MIKKILLATAIACCAALYAYAGTPLTGGTYVEILLPTKVSSKDTLAPVAVIASDVIVEGKVLIKAGTPVRTQFMRHRPRACGRAGSFNVEFLSTTSVDGQHILLTGKALEVKGVKRMGLAIGLGVGTGWLFWPSLACLAIRGKHAKLPAGTIATGIRVANNYDVATE